MRLKTRVSISCDWCGEPFEKWPSVIRKHNFCCRQCLADFSNKSKNPEGYAKLKNYTGQSQNMTSINRKLNPSRMTVTTRSKLRQARLQTEHNGRTYAKFYGRLQHRLVAEKMLGRKLREDEVVHHIDGDKRNNDPENLMVMTAAEHGRFHLRLHRFWFKGGVGGDC
jgi:hypothetical protein